MTESEHTSAVVVEVVNRFALEPPPAEQAEALKSFLLEAAAAAPRLVMDATRMTHIFSFEVAVLVHVSEALRKQGGALAICNANERVLVVIEMLGLNEHLALHDTLEACLHAHGWAAGETRRFEIVSPE
jgi:anti-anti-sigma factor